MRDFKRPPAFLPPLIYTRGRTCSVLSRELTAMEELGNLHTLYLLDVNFVGCFASLYTDYHYATYHKNIGIIVGNFVLVVVYPQSMLSVRSQS